MRRRFAIIGTGAVGGFYGILLHRAGFDVHFLLHSDFEHVREHGLMLESQERLLCSGRVNAYQNANEMPKCDVVIVALKTTQNGLLPEILPHVTASSGFVLTLQNGLGSEESIAKLVGNERVAGGLCFLSANKVGPGYIRHLDYGELLLADYRGDTKRLESLADDFRSVGIPVEISRDLLLARWKKLVWNIPFSGLSVVLHLTTDKIMADADHGSRVRRLMAEVVALAAACGRIIDPSFVQKMIDDTMMMNPYKTSMMLDFENGRPMEIEAIYGNPLRAGKAAGASAPEIEELFRQLKELEKNDRSLAANAARAIAAH